MSSSAPIPIEEVPEAIALTEPGPRAEAAAAVRALEYGVDDGRQADSLKARGIRSSIWTSAGVGCSLVIRFGSSVVLSRLLSKSDFGLAGTVGIVMGMLQQFSDIGLGPAIIQNRRGDDPKFLNTAWTMGVFRGALLWLISCALAWPVARSYHVPALMPLIAVAGFNGLLLGFTSTAIYQLNRHLALGKITLINVGTQLITTGCTIGVACVTHNVWAIIAGGLAGSAFTLVLSHFLIPGVPRNRFGWDREAAKALFHFGGWVFVSTALTFFANEVDRIIMGMISGMAVFGVYQLASTLARMPVELIARLSQMSLFPALARSAELGHDELRRKLLAARAVILPMGIAAVIGLALGAPIAVAILYPDKFQDAGWMTQMMSVGLWLTILQASADRTLLALGTARPLAICNAVNMGATIGFAFLGHYVGGQYGYAVQGFILGVAVGNLGGHLVIEAALAVRNISIYRQDAGYTALLIAIFAIGELGPRLFAANPSAHAAKSIAISWHLLVIAAASGWAGLRMLKRMR
jgi:O-antigen/teichoic acid export membrane protein